MTLHVCAPQAFRYRTVTFCPTCQRRRRMLVSMHEWYPTDFTCLTCGDSWGDGERQPRPFQRGWRPEAVAHAKAKPFTTKAEALAALRSYIESDPYREAQ